MLAMNNECSGANFDEVGFVERGDKYVEVGCKQCHQSVVRKVSGGNDEESPR